MAGRRQQAVNMVLRVAAGEIGVREIGSSNTGRRVREYQAATTLGGSGWAWCAAFVAWCIQVALTRLEFPNTWLNSASCDLILQWAQKHNLVHTKPVKGCIGLVMRTQTDATHIYIVEAITDNGDRLNTIEGNTNTGGSRNGNGVYRLASRRVSQKRSDGGPKNLFIYWFDMIDEPVTVHPEKPAQGWKVDYNGPVMLPVLPGQPERARPLILPVIQNRAYAPCRLFGDLAGYETIWNPEDQSIDYSRKYPPQEHETTRRERIHPLNAQIELLDFNGDGNLDACAPVREVVAALGLVVDANADTLTIRLWRQGD